MKVMNYSDQTDKVPKLNITGFTLLLVDLAKHSVRKTFLSAPWRWENVMEVLEEGQSRIKHTLR